jgi:hypothetical protein
MPRYLPTFRHSERESVLQFNCTPYAKLLCDSGLERGYSYADEYEMEEKPNEGERYEFVNVLWISSDGGVARREALGRVAKIYWERLGARIVDIVLGWLLVAAIVHSFLSECLK